MISKPAGDPSPRAGRGQLRRGAAIGAAASFLAVVAAGALPAFPGAEGFGANATGGRGGDVYYVTTLDDRGKGSLRDGITTAKKGPRTILFKVSGTIWLREDLSIKRPNLTLAGQSAPGDGICLAGGTLVLDANDLIVRHLRVRLGSEKRAAEDAITINGGTNIVVDHCSASWSVDEALSAAGDAQFVTVQWCLISESLNQSIHKKGSHGFGSLIRPRRDASYTFHHNLYAHHSSRNPRPGTYYGKTLRFDFCNNIIYNWGYLAGYNNFTNEFIEMNYVGNYLLAGPSTTSRRGAFAGAGIHTRIFQAGNFFDDNTNGIADGVDSGWAMFTGEYTREAQPFAAPSVITDAAPVALERVLTRAGASPWRRDAVDARVVQSVREQTGGIINTTKEVGGWPKLRAAEAPLDSDADGMPDDWERRQGLNPQQPDHNDDRNGDGYTNLEEYLNWLGDQ